VVGYSTGGAIKSNPRYLGGGYDEPTSYESYDNPYTSSDLGGATSSGSTYNTGSTTPTYVGSTNSDDIYDGDQPTYFDSQETVFNTAGEEVSAVKYKIQLGAFKQLNLDRFSSLRDLGFIEVEGSGSNVQKVVLGEFSERDFALNILEQIRNRGYRDAFLVTYYKGERQ